MTDKLDLTKPLQTRDGRNVTLITTNGRDPWPLVGYTGDDYGVPKVWDKNGNYIKEIDRSFDLMNAPEKKRSGEVWVYGRHYGPAISFHVEHKEPKDADIGKLAFKYRISWTDGEGLEGK